MTKPTSYAAFTVEIDFITGGRQIRVPAQDYFQALDFEVPDEGAWKGTLTLYDKDSAFLEDLLIGAGVDRNVRVRFNWTELGLRNAPLFTGFILTPQHAFLPDGIILNLELTATVVGTAAADKRTRSFREGMRVSEIVRAIARDRGWNTVDFAGKPTIEDTVGELSEPFSTVDESDLRFIREQLLKHAINADGDADYRFYVDQTNAVHFHTYDFLAPRTKQFDFARGGDGEVLLFAPSETSYLAQIGGGGNAKFRSSSSLDGSEIAQEGTVRAGVEGDGDRVDSTSTSVRDLGDGVSSIQPITARDLEELQRVARTRRAAFSKYHISADMDVLGSHDLRTLDYVDFRYLKRTGGEHYLSGKYQIRKLRHRLDNTGWRTTYALSRSGIQPQQGTLTRTSSRTTNPQPIASS